MHKSNSIKKVMFYNDNDPNQFAKFIIKVLGEEIGKKVHGSTQNTKIENVRIESTRTEDTRIESTKTENVRTENNKIENSI